MRYRRYRIHLHSQPGMWTYYDGYVDVWAEDRNEATDMAKEKLKRTSFPDRPVNSWIVTQIEELP